MLHCLLCIMYVDKNVCMDKYSLCFIKTNKKSATWIEYTFSTFYNFKISKQ